jgi:general stress protein 26
MSAKQTDQVQPIEKFRDLLRKFDDAMLVSVDATGQLHGRPMRIVAHHQDSLDDLWFVTGLDSEKVAEMLAEPRVAVTLSDGKRYLSISGDARVVADPAKVEAMWQESWKLWYPEGPRSGKIALIQVRPIRAEYWDQSLPNGIRFALEAAKAWVKDEKIDEPDGPEQHAKVRFG